MTTFNVADLEAWRGERMYWDVASEEDRRLHLARYSMARELFRTDWKCLDAACGSGYGSAFLAEKVSFVDGVDVDRSAIEFAKARYERPNLNYHNADLQAPLPFADASFDAITCFETLEHLEKQTEMLREFYRVLKTNGLLVISSPDRKVSEKFGWNNRFHVGERTTREFVGLLREGFDIEKLLGQGDAHPVSRQWTSVHRFLKFGANAVRSSTRSTLERWFTRPFRWIRGHFAKITVDAMQPITDLDKVGPVFIVAVARKRYPR